MKKKRKKNITKKRYFPNKYIEKWYRKNNVFLRNLSRKIREKTCVINYTRILFPYVDPVRLVLEHKRHILMKNIENRI